MKYTPYQTKSEYLEALSKVEEAARAYYDTDELHMDDATYDGLLKRLEASEKVHPEWKLSQATSAVGAGVASGGEVVHSSVMLSLENAMGDEELESWFTRLFELVGEVETCIEPKLDGLAVSIRYEGGKLIQVATRGDGTSGEDVTEQAARAKGVPGTIKNKGVLEVRGEIYMSDVDFAEANELREKAKKETFKNPRNAAAGVLRLIHDKTQYPLSFAAYDKVGGAAHDKAMDELEGLGFSTARTAARLKKNRYTGYKQVMEVVRELGNRRAELGFAIDGAVVKVAENSVRQEVGQTAKAPRWAIAYKYPADARQTKVVSIVVQVGRTGVLTPVAELEPVDVGGVSVRRTTLSNPSEVARKDVRVGDTVWVRRAGEVIPEIVSVEMSKRPKNSKPWTPPSTCPRCSSSIDTSSKRWRCTNRGCGLPEAVRFFAGRDGMDIDGLGKWLIGVLVEDGSVKKVEDLYELRAEDLVGKSAAEPFLNQNGKRIEPRISKDSADKLIASIEQSKGRKVEAVICALGIGMVGRKLAANLTQKYATLPDLMRVSAEELSEIEGIGDVRAAQIVEDVAEMRETIKSLIGHGVGIQAAAKS
jgi:DNA ligase (NAD+)